MGDRKRRAKHCDFVSLFVWQSLKCCARLSCPGSGRVIRVSALPPRLKIAHSPIWTLPLHWSGLLIQYLNRLLVYLAYIVIIRISEYTKRHRYEPPDRDKNMCVCLHVCNTFFKVRVRLIHSLISHFSLRLFSTIMRKGTFYELWTCVTF